MIDITHKPTTLREATAEATVSVSLAGTIAAVKEKRVPKGDVLEAARIAGLFGIKRTADINPHRHPLPIEHAEVTFDVQAMAILVKVEVGTIYRTGVEVEVMHGASVAALTIYDMLKPIDKGITIDRIRPWRRRVERAIGRIHSTSQRARAVPGQLVTAWPTARRRTRPAPPSWSG